MKSATYHEELARELLNEHRKGHRVPKGAIRYHFGIAARKRYRKLMHKLTTEPYVNFTFGDGVTKKAEACPVSRHLYRMFGCPPSADAVKIAKRALHLYREGLGSEEVEPGRTAAFFVHNWKLEGV